jgi:hypothetical protein
MHPNKWTKVAPEMQQNPLWATKQNAKSDFFTSHNAILAPIACVGNQKRGASNQSRPK